MSAASCLRNDDRHLFGIDQVPPGQFAVHEALADLGRVAKEDIHCKSTGASLPPAVAHDGRERFRIGLTHHRAIPSPSIIRHVGIPRASSTTGWDINGLIMGIS